jgi:hypothetical protein
VPKTDVRELFRAGRRQQRSGKARNFSIPVGLTARPIFFAFSYLRVRRSTAFLYFAARKIPRTDSSTREKIREFQIGPERDSGISFWSDWRLRMSFPQTQNGATEKNHLLDLYDWLKPTASESAKHAQFPVVGSI